MQEAKNKPLLMYPKDERMTRISNETIDSGEKQNKQGKVKQMNFRNKNIVIEVNKKIMCQQVRLK